MSHKNREDMQDLKETKHEVVENATSACGNEPKLKSKTSKFGPSVTPSNESLFDIHTLSEDTVNSDMIINYKEMLTKETIDWTDMLIQVRQNIKRLKKSEIVIDDNEITEEQRIYFRNSTINFKEFEEDSIKFQVKAINFLEEHTELMESHDYTLSLYGELIDDIVSDIITTHFTI